MKNCDDDDYWLRLQITNLLSEQFLSVRDIQEGREREKIETVSAFGFQVESRFPGISYQVIKWDQDWKGNLMGKEGNGKLSGV